MKTKMLKSVLSLTLALALIFGSGLRLGSTREQRPQCDWDYTYVAQ